MTATIERLVAIEVELARQGSILDRLELAVVGNGSAGSSLRERVSGNETDISNLKGWRHRALAGAGQTVLSLCAAIITTSLGLHLPGHSSV